MKKLIGPAIISAIVLADQLSKWAVLETLFRNRLGLGDPMRFTDWLANAPERFPAISVEIVDIFNLTMVWNEGISFGLLQNGGWGVLTVAGIIISSLFAVWMFRAEKMGEIIALSMIVGGAIGNIFDRIRFGAVADFFDFHWKDWHFPAFNVADSAISVGVVILLVLGLFFDKKSA